MSLEWEKISDFVHPWLNDAIKSLGFPSMTPVQASTIPLFSGNKDVVVQSVTGSGKTLAFAIPVLHHISCLLYGLERSELEPTILKRGQMAGIIVSPTRELAHQIQSVFERIIAFLPDSMHKIKTQLVVGSLNHVREDVEYFLNERTHIIVGTPGRLLEFISQPKVRTNNVEIVVLDEADRLLDMSFEADVLAILKQLPKQRRTGLFSATLSASGDRIFKTGMLNPVKITAQSKLTLPAAPSSLSIRYLVVKAEQKLSALINLLESYKFKKCMIYFPTCISVKHFYTLLLLSQTDMASSVKLYSLYGLLLTTARLKTLKSFTESDASWGKHCLLATDVAARGIDVVDVDLVIQVDPPNDPDVFLHRCGRAGRANRSGNAIVLLNADTQETNFVDFMEVKGILMSEVAIKVDENLHKCFYDKVKLFMLEDRSRHETAVKAYVAFVRFYSKHLAKSIFRVQSLDYLGIAKMYGLIRLPKMPESRYIANDVMPEEGWLIEERIDMDKYAFADPVKEKARVENLESEKERKRLEAKRRRLASKQNQAWSSKNETKEAKAERRMKIKRKRDELEKELLEQSSEDEQVEGDWKDLVRQNKRKKQESNVQGLFEDL